MADFGKRTVASPVASRGGTKPPHLQPKPRTRFQEAAVAAFALCLIGASLHALNAIAHDSQSTKLWFVGWWCVIGSPLVSLYLYFTAPDPTDRT